MRTCIGCRGTASRSVLVRIVGAEVHGRSQAVPDPDATLPGRGAWLHRDLGCVELAVRRKAASRALRLSGPVDLDAVRRVIEAEQDEPHPPPHDRKRVEQV